MKVRLVVLIDFSVYAHAVLELAGKWAAAIGAEIHIVHQTAGLTPGFSDKDTRNELRQQETTETHTKLKKLAESRVPLNVPVSYTVGHDHLLNILENTLNGKTNDFVILGVKGTGFLKRVLMGSMATKVIDSVNVPVIAVPDKLCAGTKKLCNLLPRKIYVTVHESFSLNREAFSAFLNVFSSVIRQLEFITVTSGTDDNKLLTELTEEYAPQFPAGYSIFEGNNAFEEICKNVQTDNDTVLLVQRGSRSFTDQIFRKFLINQLVHDGSIPLVILP